MTRSAAFHGRHAGRESDGDHYSEVERDDDGGVVLAEALWRDSGRGLAGSMSSVQSPGRPPEGCVGDEVRMGAHQGGLVVGGGGSVGDGGSAGDGRGGGVGNVREPGMESWKRRRRRRRRRRRQHEMEEELAARVEPFDPRARVCRTERVGSFRRTCGPNRPTPISTVNPIMIVLHRSYFTSSHFQHTNRNCNTTHVPKGMFG